MIFLRHSHTALALDEDEDEDEDIDYSSAVVPTFEYCCHHHVADELNLFYSHLIFLRHLNSVISLGRQNTHPAWSFTNGKGKVLLCILLPQGTEHNVVKVKVALPEGPDHILSNNLHFEQ